MKNDEISDRMRKLFLKCGTNKKHGKKRGIGFLLYEFKVVVLNVSSEVRDVASRVVLSKFKRTEKSRNVTLTGTIFHFSGVGLESSVRAGIPRDEVFWGFPVLHFLRDREDRVLLLGGFE